MQLTVMSKIGVPIPGVSWKLTFKSATGKIKESLKIIRLPCSFNDVGIKPSTQGNWFTVQTNVKHFLPQSPHAYLRHLGLTLWLVRSRDAWKKKLIEPEVIMLIRTFNNAQCNRLERVTDIHSSLKNIHHPSLPYAWCYWFLGFNYTFRHVEVQLTERGNSQTINSSVKHRLPPPQIPPLWCVGC